MDSLELASSLASINWPNNYYYLQAQTEDSMKSLTFSLNEKSYSSITRSHASAPSRQKPTLQISPNPFNPNTRISCYLPLAGKAKISIYNLKGQLVKKIVDDYLPAGPHRFEWDSRDEHKRGIASGVYFIRVESNGETTTSKAVLLK